MSFLLFGGDDVEGQDGEHGAIHGHRDRHLAEVDLVEEDFHVEDAVDGHTGLADVAHDALVVRVITAVGGQVEGTGETLLTGGDVAAVEGVGLLGGGETGVLADGPGAHDVHRRVGSAQEGRDTGGIVQVLHAGQVLGTVGGLDVNLLRGLPVFLNVVLFLPIGEVLTRTIDRTEIDF